MDSEDRLIQAGEEARRSAAAASIPDLAARDKTVRVRRGLAMLAMAAASIVAVAIPLRLIGDTPQVSVVDPLEEQSADETVVARTCIDPPLQLDGGLSRAEEFTVLFPNADCQSGYEGVPVLFSTPSTDTTTLAPLIVEGFSKQFGLAVHRVELSLRTVVLDVDGSSADEQVIQGLAASLLQAVDYSAVQLVIDGECPAGTTCRYDRASVGLPEADQPGVLRHRAPTVPGGPEELARREPYPFCGYSNVDTNGTEFVTDCVAARSEGGLPFEYMILGDAGGIYQVVRSDGVLGARYVNMDEPGTGSPTGWWMQACDEDGCGEMIELGEKTAVAGSCDDSSIVGQMDAMLSVVNLTAEWERGRSGALSGRLPAPSAVAECVDYYRGDLGEGRFADGLAFKVGGELFVTILPSPPKEGWDFAGGGGSISFNGEIVHGLVEGAVFVGIYGEGEILLAFPYMEVVP